MIHERYLESKCHKYLNFWKLLKSVETKRFYKSVNDTEQLQYIVYETRIEY